MVLTTSLRMENLKLCKKHLLGLYQSKEQKRRARKLQQDTQQILKRIEWAVCTRHRGVVGCDMPMEIRYKIKRRCGLKNAIIKYQSKP